MNRTSPSGPAEVVRVEFWRGLERMRGDGGVIREWQRAGGGAFELLQPFLRASGRRAGSIPCPAPVACACRHEVRESERLGLVAACQCARWDCGDFPLAREEALVWSLDRGTLGRAVAAALELERTRPETGSNAALFELGRSRVRSLPLFLGLGAPPVLAQEVLELAARRPEPFLLLTPGEAKDELLDRALRQSAGAQASLCAWCCPEPGGFLRCDGAGKEFIRRQLASLAQAGSSDRAFELVRREIAALRGDLAAARSPAEPLPEDAARQAFALVKALDSETGIRRGSVYTVFRLYCLEGLSAEQVAKRCGCSKGTVINRLRRIERQTGLKPDRLRVHSGQFEAIEESLSDSRARRIHRRGALDQPDEEE